MFYPTKVLLENNYDVSIDCIIEALMKIIHVLNPI